MAVNFSDAHILADDTQSKTADNQILRESLSARLSGTVQGDLIEMPLNGNKVLKLEVVEPGLYSGWFMDAINNDILGDIDKQTFDQVLGNIINRDPSLNVETKVEEMKPEIPKNVVININISKAIEELADLSKAKGDPVIGFTTAVDPETTKDEKKIEDEQKKESGEGEEEEKEEKSKKKKAKKSHQRENDMNKSEIKELVKEIWDSFPENIDTITNLKKAASVLKACKEDEKKAGWATKVLQKKYGKAEGKKKTEKSLFNLVESDMNKAVEDLEDGSTDTLIWEDFNDYDSEQGEIIKANLERSLKDLEDL